MLKQDLATAYDFNLDALYNHIDDCNFKFIDTSNLKRFLVKCCIYASDTLLIAIIRRMDLDADARLSAKEFMDGVSPIENFTKGSLSEMKKVAKKSVTMASASNYRKSGRSLGSTMKRPGTAKVQKPFADILNANKTGQELGFEQQNNDYQRSYAQLDGYTGSMNAPSHSEFGSKMGRSIDDRSHKKS